MIKEPWRTVLQVIATIITSLLTCVSATASGLTHYITAML